MDFQGPETADLANVYSLNLAFLEALRRHDRVFSSAGPGVAGLLAKLVPLGSARSDCLAQSPFLIYGLADSSSGCWKRLFNDEEHRDLVDSLVCPPEAVARLAAATLGFLWELARRNSYAARLVSGASLAWCEQLAGSSSLRLVQFAMTEPGLMAPRMPTRMAFWAKLLGPGTSEEKEIRRSAQLCALQTLLTRPAIEPYQRMRTAACSMPAPTMRVADRKLRPTQD